MLFLILLTAGSDCSKGPLNDDALRECLDNSETRAEVLANIDREIRTPDLREGMLAQLRLVIVTDDAELRAALAAILLREKVFSAKVIAAIPTRAQLQKANAAADKRVETTDCQIEANMEVVCRHRFCRPGCQVMEARLRYKLLGLKLLESKEIRHGDTGECGCCMFRQ